MRQVTELQQQMQARANAINDLAGNIRSLDDSRKLVDLVAAEFSKELPPKWATRSLRNRIARAEFETAYDPGSLIPEQHVADAWNDYLQKIGAPQESYVTAVEIHTLRDTYYVTTQVSWVRGNQNVWTVPDIYAVGPDGKVANGCRAIEVLKILWQLADQPELLQGTRDLIKTGQLWSDMVKNPSKPPAPGRRRVMSPLEWCRCRQTPSETPPCAICTTTANAPSTARSKACSRTYLRVEGQRFQARWASGAGLPAGSRKLFHCPSLPSFTVCQSSPL